MNEEGLITEYKADFFVKTGKRLKVRVCTRWEGICELPVAMELETVLKMILDATGWTFDDVFTKRRHGEYLFRRGLIYFILTHNDFSLLKLAQRTDKDHTTIINARRRFEERLEAEPLTSKILLEVMDFINNNYQFYHQ